MIAILHNIRSLYNVGSMFRTAEGAGVEKLYLCGITPTPVDILGSARQPLAKVALGAETMVPWEYRKSTTLLINNLKKRGYKVYAIEQDKRSVSYSSAIKDSSDKIALMVGHEVEGLPKTIVDKADVILEIPMYGKKESLNVSVAFGIIAYELCRKK
ncbi:MAG: TrmH family RNA methyltransferase [bacterium]